MPRLTWFVVKPEHRMSREVLPADYSPVSTVESRFSITRTSKRNQRGSVEKLGFHCIKLRYVPPQMVWFWAVLVRNWGTTTFVGQVIFKRKKKSEKEQLLKNANENQSRADGVAFVYQWSQWTCENIYTFSFFLLLFSSQTSLNREAANMRAAREKNYFLLVRASDRSSG